MNTNPSKGEIPSPPRGEEGIPHPSKQPSVLAQSEVLRPPHSPLPWHVENAFVFAADGTQITDEVDSSWVEHANAAHIVRCVNAFDDLLAACKAAAEFIPGIHDPYILKEVCERAAAKAEGGAP